LYFSDLNEIQKAAYHMGEAAKCPGAPSWYESLAARMYVSANEPDMAISILESLYMNEVNEDLKKDIAYKIKLVYIDKTILELDKLRKQYEAKFAPMKTLQELVEKGFIKEIPRDPFGGNYFLDLKEGKIKTNSTKERFRPYGKN
jgi:hypothetical protein